ncbi:unnamed protein product [Ambrosiozyma monospora]|uniref:Unnamed protein product n=1 Tax=Ambrosiozyma monospora TaxID=43982 RepID=A0ACB5U1J0_AMBMO|nr:unnamed protein product [Ambrosiozyma monospora]
MTDQQNTQIPNRSPNSSTNSAHIDHNSQKHQLTANSTSSSHSRTNINDVATDTASFEGPPNINQNTFKPPHNPIKLNTTESKDNKNSNKACVPTVVNQGKSSNLQSSHHGTVISPPMSILLLDTPSISIGNWQIFCQRKPISSMSEIKSTESCLKFPVPEMIFGHNLIKVVCEDKFHIEFNAIDALRRVQSKSENLVQVSYPIDWLNSRVEKHDDDKVTLEMSRPFDWTYSTDYKGTLIKGDFIRDDSKTIPLDKLTRQDPILFSDDMILYEDDLGNHGISILNVKLRAMRSCMLFGY